MQYIRKKPRRAWLRVKRYQKTAGSIFVQPNGALVVKMPNDLPTDALAAEYPDGSREFAR